jgi:hypothetical protein
MTKMVLLLLLGMIVGVMVAECISQTPEEVTTPAKQED